MKPGPNTYHDPSDAPEVAPALSLGAETAIATAVASDKDWQNHGAAALSVLDKEAK
ncbi:MAG: hypothetical protein US89_C0004G0105 [Candidatus Peregrinibacteria bacterium GW2011_GWF2_38_29]|nr:MAG: hypothetical protein US89_C0004G0105 [Candidatus Peregrinibacteria bacterium GW2011_GWF2_38_29]